MSQSQANESGFVFTGRHMLAIMLAFFGVIIGVNLLMAYYASSTWSGLVAPNTYVASQEFNGKQAKARAFLATGIKGELSVTPKSVSYTLNHPEKGPVLADAVTVKFRRPVGEHQDFALSLTPAGKGRFVANHDVLAGEWIVDLTSLEAGRTGFQEITRIHVGAVMK